MANDDQQVHAALVAGRRTSARRSLIELAVLAGVVGWVTLGCRAPSWVVAPWACLVLARCVTAMLVTERTIRKDGAPAPAGLQGRVGVLAARAGVRMPLVHTVRVHAGPGAESTVRRAQLSMNAAAADDFAPGSTLTVGEHLMDAMRPEEQDAVLAHEIAHLAHARPVAKLLRGLSAESWSQTLWIAPLMVVLGPHRWQALTMTVLSVPMTFALAALGAACSRRDELAADRTGAALVGSPVPMAAAVTRLAGLHAGVTAWIADRPLTVTALDEYLSSPERVSVHLDPMDATQVRSAAHALPDPSSRMQTHPPLLERVTRLLG